jgi:protein O-mannosyl-transferase
MARWARGVLAHYTVQSVLVNERPAHWTTPSIVALAVASSIVGIVNAFTYDDRFIVQWNPFVHRLSDWWRVFENSYWPPLSGGDGYRPLTILAFKVEWALGAGSPISFHVANIVLYVLVSILVLRLGQQVFDRQHQWAAWLTAAMFAVHPVHVEAVANVVGQSELIVALAVVLATLLYLRDRSVGALSPRTAAWITLLYVVACLSKEHGIVLPAILVAAELTLLDCRGPWRERIPALRPFYSVLALVAVAFVATRATVLVDEGLVGFHPFTPFSSLQLTNGQRVLTALGVVPQWLRLLYWPAHLSTEYGPPDLEIAQGPSITQLPGVALLVAGATLVIVLRRRRPVVSFGIAFAGICLLPSSNLILPAGILLAERTLFLPSVGAMLLASAVAMPIAERLHARSPRVARMLAQVAVGGVLAAGLAWSTWRTTFWHDNDRLFRQAVKDTPLAYRAHYMLGAWHFENERRREGEAEYRHALKLFPYDPFLSYSLAEQYRRVGMCGPALPLYRWTFGLDTNFKYGRSAFAWCLLNEDSYDEAREQALKAIDAGADVRSMHRVIFITDSVNATKRPSPVARAGAVGKLPDSSALPCVSHLSPGKQECSNFVRVLR